MTIDNYSESCAYLEEESKRRGMVLGLDTMRALMEELGNPQNQLRIIHIAGTNGKGSTASYIYSILNCQGYLTGLYTSPAVFDRREQYQISGAWIDISEFVRCTKAVRDAADRVEKKTGIRPTGFEQETAIGFLHFAWNKCEFLVLETGLGGDSDATNIVTTTICSVVTSISIDHRRILGENLEEIAGHKAGIIKADSLAVVLDQDERVIDVIKKQCSSLKAKLRIADSDQMEMIRHDESGILVNYKNLKNLHTTQTALWQQQNLTLSLETVFALRDNGIEITDAAIYAGVGEMTWKGRFEIRKWKTEQGTFDIVIDGAHNPAGAKALYESLHSLYPDKKKLFVMGVLADKDYFSIIDILLEDAKAVFTLASDSPRALPADELAQAIQTKKANLPVKACASLRDALENASCTLKTAGAESSVIIICGSLSFMKELKTALQDEK